MSLMSQNYGRTQSCGMERGSGCRVCGIRTRPNECLCPEANTSSRPTLAKCQPRWMLGNWSGPAVASVPLKNMPRG